MTLLLIGSGAREHAIARALKKHNPTLSISACMSTHNPALMAICDTVFHHKRHDVAPIVSFATAHHSTLAIIGPEAPLQAGLADALAAANIPTIGPTQPLARIETSKGFARDILSKHKVAGIPRYRFFDTYSDMALGYLNELGSDFVIKADGLMGGKGVLISGEHLHSHAEAIAHCQQLHQPFVIEEKLSGPEFSLMSFVDGNSMIHMPVVQDHKRAFVGDKGPNTGGMGSYSLPNHRLPFLTESALNAAQKINENAMLALQAETQARYVGILYGGFMLTQHGVKLIEYNARFGDPEVINVLSILNDDFLDICQHMVAGTLHTIRPTFKAEATVVKYIVPKGYPTNPVKNQPIHLHHVTQPERLFYASVDQESNQLIMTGSRAMAVLGLGKTIAAAEKQAQQTAAQIGGDCFFRADIGTAELIQTHAPRFNMNQKNHLAQGASHR